MIYRIFAKFAICLLFLIVSCAVNPVTGKQELILISEKQEIELGKQAAPSLNWEFGGQYHDPALESYLNEIVKNIWQVSERPHLSMEFYIQNTSLPNAFALPGYVAITRGLLSDLETEAQFAAIMGHEAGHVMARHTAQRLSRITLQQMGLAIGSTFLEETKGADALLTIGAIGTSLLLLKYDRGQEIQSDRLGVKYMAKLGYNPHEALAAHELLETSVNGYLKRAGKTRSNDNFISNLLSTHPRKADRLNEIKAVINELPAYDIKSDGKFSRRFQNSIKRIREINNIYFVYDEAEHYYQKGDFESAEQKLQQAIKLSDQQAPFYNLSGFVKLQQKNYSEARGFFNKALSIDPGYQPSIYGLGLVHYSGKNYNQAINEFKRSLALYPGHPGTHFALGQSYFSLQRYREAIPYLKNFAGFSPDNPEVHGLAGICYENTGNIEFAVIEYKKQIKIAPNTKLGKHSRKRLSALEPMLKK